MSTKAASPCAKVNDTSLLDDDQILLSDVELMSDESLRQLQRRLGINAMSGKIDRLSAIVEQAFTVDSAQPCKRKRTTQFDPCDTLDVTQAEDGDVPEIIELPPSVFDVREAQDPKVLKALAKRVNDSFTTKPIGDKLNSLYEEHKTPER